VPGDTNGASDIFVRDLVGGTTERVSIPNGSGQADAASYAPSISADGRFVVFESEATNLVGGDTNNLRDIFVRDRQLGVTERVDVPTGGGEADATSYTPSISADGRFVSFGSLATDLVGGDTNGTGDVFLRDRQIGTTARVSVDSAGAQGNFVSDDPVISADGRYVAFRSYATNLVPGDTNGFTDVFVRDRIG